ncbi:MAG: hypothetical protein IPM50_09315 [Acidobacteriota bacterium]|nr:MAG: hypothetical protein IPM50_09315 [Acidobacteriota bacterium]
MAKTALQKSLERSTADRDLSQQLLGASKYATALHRQTGSDLLRFLITVRDDKRYLDYDCQNFDEFLDSVHSPISRPTFYRQLELFKLEGDKYDLMSEWRIPVYMRKLLSAGDVTVDGDEAVIGDQRISLNGGGVGVKELVERLVKDKIASENSNAKLEGYKAKYDELKAKVDAAAEKPEYVVAYMNAVEALLVLIAEVNVLPGEVKANRAAGDLSHIGELMDQLSRAYGKGGSTRQPAPAMFVSLDGDNF